MYPDSVRFIRGPYSGLIFNQGMGPTERKNVDGRVVLINSTNFWYSDSQSLSADFIQKNKQDWVEEYPIRSCSLD